MKTKLIFIAIAIFGVLSVAMPVAAQTKSSADAASEAYRAGDFKKSIELYNGIVAQRLSEGEESAEIYYNLGNAYFRDNQLAEAILYYERALLLNPGDSDIRHNLRFARTRIEDKIDTSGSLFLTNWVNSIQNRFNSNTWGSVAVVLFILFLLCVGGYLFLRVLWIKKAAFYTGIVVFALMIVANLFAFRQKNLQIDRNTGIVMAGAASIRTSPRTNSKELFQLHAGTKVKVKDTDGNWYEIEIANGSVGWIPKENVEII